MKQLFCIGNYSTNGIVCLNFNHSSFIPVSNFSIFSNCSYLAKNNNFVYLVSETSNGIIASYKKEKLSFCSLNHTSSYGQSPCHIMIDSIRNILYVSHYEDGSLAAFQLNQNGNIGNKLDYKKFKKDVSHIHCTALSHDKEHLFVIDLGTNNIYAYSIITEPSFLLQLRDTFSFPTYTQPRHLVLDSENRIHIITENTCEIYTLSFKNNIFSFLFKTSLIPKILKKENGDTGCAIKISKNHNLLYTSIRGKNLICVFKILEHKLNLIQSISCYGIIPRDISLDKSENHLICANQGSNNLSAFSLSPKNGTLSFKFTYSIEKPSCILPL